MIRHGSRWDWLDLFALIGAIRTRYAPTCLPLAIALLLVSSLLSPALGDAHEDTIRLRVAWGGGTPRPWNAEVVLDRGRILEVQSISLEGDSPGATYIAENGAVMVTPRWLRSYDGFDLTISANAELLKIRLIHDPATGAQTHLELPIREILRRRVVERIGETGSRLIAHRLPGDDLRLVNWQGSIMAPDQPIELEITPSRVPITAGGAYRLEGRVYSEEGVQIGEALIAQVELDRDGNALQSWKKKLTAPHAEGVYRIALELYPSKRASLLAQARAISERSVQFVVVDGAIPTESTDSAVESTMGADEWRLVGEIDPAHPRFLERLTQIPTLNLLPNWKKAPVGFGDQKVVERNGSQWTQLGPSGWVAYPIPISAIGKPHKLEFEYPGDLPQSLVISIVEPNPAGQVVSPAIDSGIDTDELFVSFGAEELARHELEFWPRTSSPFLLVHNMRANQPGMFGKFRIVTREVRQKASTLVARQDGRECYEFLARPLFVRRFGAPEVVEAKSSRPLEDWSTFYVGIDRLIQDLVRRGRSGALLTVACESSSLYPSERLAPTPRLDTGTFFENAQDPERKDVLELAFRRFDHAGLKLIPTIEVSGPLPDLERLRRETDPRGYLGIDLVDPDGRPTRSFDPNEPGHESLYNLADPRVRDATLRVIEEVIERYSAHASFGGVAIQLGAYSGGVFPDESWGVDAMTYQRFLTETAAKTSRLSVDSQSHARRVRDCLGDRRESWLRWRAKQVTDFYRQTAKMIKQHRADAELLLCPTQSPSSRMIVDRLKDTQQPYDKKQLWLSRGIDIGMLQEVNGIVLPMSTCLDAPSDGERHRLANGFSSINTGSDEGAKGTAMISCETWTEQLSSFKERNPFGKQNTDFWLISQVAPTGYTSCRPFVNALTTSDAKRLIIGGWAGYVSPNAAERNFLKIFSSLPNEPFDAVTIGAEAESKGIVARAAVHNEESYIYAVNPNPWPLDVLIQFQTTNGAVFYPLTENGPGAGIGATKGLIEWETKLEPFGLIAGVCDSDQFAVDAFRVNESRAVTNTLREAIRDLDERLSAIRTPRSSVSLANPGFEEIDRSTETPIAWRASTDEGVEAWLENEGHASKRSLRLSTKYDSRSKKTPVGWVRSDPFAPPVTGRLMMVAWLKIPEGAPQPKLRMVVDGRRDGKSYYRRANVGAPETKGGANPQPIGTEWSSHAFAITDLPMDGLTDLQVGFDLMEEGEVLIDDVRVYDVWLEEAERNELWRTIALANQRIKERRTSEALELLDGYWPRSLREHAPEPEARLALRTPDLGKGASPPAKGTSEPKSSPDPATSGEGSAGMLKRMQRWITNPFR